MKRMNQNMVVGIIFILFSLIIYTQTLGLPPHVAIFPKTCVGIMALMGILAIVHSVFDKRKAAQKTVFRVEIAVASAALLTCYALMAYVGFYTAAALFIFFIFLYTERDWRPVSFVKGGVFSIATTAVLYFLFSILMNLMPPEGLFI